MSTLPFPSTPFDPNANHIYGLKEEGKPDITPMPSKPDRDPFVRWQLTKADGDRGHHIAVDLEGEAGEQWYRVKLAFTFNVTRASAMEDKELLADVFVDCVGRTLSRAAEDLPGEVVFTAPNEANLWAQARHSLEFGEN